jgi:hypothetical protein
LGEGSRLLALSPTLLYGWGRRMEPPKNRRFFGRLLSKIFHLGTGSFFGRIGGKIVDFF